MRAGGVYDPDALIYMRAVEAADGQSLEYPVKAAINTYVVTLKADSVWTSAAQLLLPCGPRTLAGALKPLKGTAPTNVNFVSGDYNRENGLGKASNSNAYLNSNVNASSVGIYSHALFVYGSLVNSGTSGAIGQYDSGGANIIDMFDWVDVPGYLVGRTFRGGSFAAANCPLITSSTATASLIGSRTSSSSAAIYSDSATVINTTSIVSYSPTRPFYIFGTNNAGALDAASSSVLQATGIFSTGLNATQAAALRSATATYVAAVAAAIP